MLKMLSKPKLSKKNLRYEKSYSFDSKRLYKKRGPRSKLLRRPICRKLRTSIPRRSVVSKTTSLTCNSRLSNLSKSLASEKAPSRSVSKQSQSEKQKSEN